MGTIVTAAILVAAVVLALVFSRRHGGGCGCGCNGCENKKNCTKEDR